MSIELPPWLLLLLLLLRPSTSAGGAQHVDLLVEALVEDLSHGEGLQARHGGRGGRRICECENFFL